MTNRSPNHFRFSVSGKEAASTTVNSVISMRQGVDISAASIYIQKRTLVRERILGKYVLRGTRVH